MTNIHAQHTISATYDPEELLTVTKCQSVVYWLLQTTEWQKCYFLWMGKNTQKFKFYIEQLKHSDKIHYKESSFQVLYHKISTNKVDQF